MPATCKVHQLFAAKNIMDALYDISAGSPASVKCALMSTGFVFNPTSTDYDSYEDAAISGDEITTAGGYSIGGVLVTGFTYVASTGLVSCDNVAFSAVAVDMDGAVAAVFYFESDLVTPHDPVICCIEFGATYLTKAGTTFRIGLSNGLFQVTANPT